MPSEIDAAVKTKWNASSAITSAITGGIWADEVPEDKSLPFARYTEVSDNAGEFSTSSKYENQSFRISVFDYTRELVQAKLKIVEDELGETLSIAGASGRTLLRMRRVTRGVEFDDPNWHGFLVYELLTRVAS